MRMAMNTYLTVVISVIDQKTSDRMPSTAARSVCAKPPWPLRNVCMVYSGEVPMSPYTTTKRHDGHGRRDFVRTGLETAPPAADAALAGGLVKFRGFLLLRLMLLDERLALLLGQDLVRDLWRLRVRRCVKQRLFFFVRLVSHNASSKWRAFQPAPQNKTQGVTLGAWQTIVKSSHAIRHVTHEIHIYLIVYILLIFWRLRNCYVEAHATVTEPPRDYREIAILFRCRTLRASFHAWLWRFQPNGLSR